MGIGLELINKVTKEGPGRVRVLAIDDNRKLLDVFVRVLQREGHDVLTTLSGEAGIALIDELKEEVDVVIIDSEMPGLSGVPLADELRKIAPVPVLFRAGISLRASCPKLPDNSLLLEFPTSAADLRAKVRRLTSAK